MNGAERGNIPAVVGVEPAARPEERRQRRLRQWADAAIAVALALLLLVIFALDRRLPAAGALFARQGGYARILFDPLRTPTAEVRQHAQRELWIGEFGGTEQSEAAVRAGLDWLARHQAEDGHWGPDCLHAAPAGRCLPADVCSIGGSDHRVAQTGLAVLAFQAGGHYDFNENQFSECVRRGLDWLLRNQRDDGGFREPARGPGSCNMYEHGIAAFALADACEMADSAQREPDDRYRQAAQKAARFIEYVQHNDGGWRYTEDREQPSDTSVSGWQVLALHAAKRARIVEIREECVRQVEEFFRRCELGQSGRTGYMPRSNLTDATTGVGMLVHEFLLEQPDSPLVKQGAEYLADRAEQPWKKVPALRRRLASADGDFYTWYNCTLAMFQAGGEPWKRWNNIVRDTIVQHQRQDPQSCIRGSWDPHGQGAGEGGRIYSTALAVLTLEVYYRYKSERAKVYAK